MEHIPVLDNFLRENFSESRIWSLSTKQVDLLYKNIILLSANLLKTKDFNQELKFLDSLERKELRKAVRESPRILLGLRGFIFKIIQESPTKLKDIYKYYKDYELYRNSFNTPISTNLLVLPFIKRSGILNDYAVIIKNQPKALTPKEAKILCKDELKKLHPYIQGYTYKKLRFIYHSNNMEFEDMVNTLECSICNSCYITLANRRGLHLTNTLRRGITNAGINLIKYYNTRGRRRLIADEGEDTGYSNIILSTNVISDCGEDGDLIESTDIYCEDNREYLELRSTFFLAKKYLQEKYGEASIQARLIDILSNQSNEFITWYNEKYKMHYNDISSIADDTGSRFYSIIKEYFNLREPAFKRILNQIKPHLIEMPKVETNYPKEQLIEDMEFLLKDLGILPQEYK